MPTEPAENLRLEIGHVLFLDIVGYSKLLIEEQKERVRKLTDVVLATSQVAKSTDEELVRLPTGDGMALVFRHSAEEPARCGLEIAQALKSHPDLTVRMGIHSGPVSDVIDVSGRKNIAGAGINIAQRVMDCGDAGHILVSQRVAEDLTQYRQWSPLLHDLGECEVKHGVRLHLVNLYDTGAGNPSLPKKVRAFQRRKRIRWAIAAAALVLAAAAAFFVLSRKSAQFGEAVPSKSIAVLPFANLSSDKENAYFADGIQDEILTRLSKIADLKVISRTSTQHYKSAPGNVPEIGRQLGVAHVLEGSVQKSGETVRVNVQLIKTANDSHVWAEFFDRKLTDIFAVESEVAETIADQLQARLTGREKQVIAAKPTDNPEAYDAYLRGLAYTLKSGYAAEQLAAQKYLKEAVRLDPKFALGWALLSYVDSVGYLTHSLQPTVTLREEAQQAAETAITLQPNLGEAILAKGYYYYACLKDYDTTVLYFERARQFMPNSSRISESLAYVARRRGQWDQSENYFKEAERLDPRDVELLFQRVISYYHLRRFPDAVRTLDRILDITPDDIHILVEKAIIAQAEGDLPRAAAILAPLHPAADDFETLNIQIYQALLERRFGQIIPRLTEMLAKPDPALGFSRGKLQFWLGWAEQLTGDRAAAMASWDQARAEQESFLKQQPENWRLMDDLALTNMGLGDKAAAFSLVERAMATMPIEKDALQGPGPLEALARVAAQMGEPDRAIATLEKLLLMPGYLTPALLRLDPMFDPLRNDARFQELCEAKRSR